MARTRLRGSCLRCLKEILRICFARRAATLRRHGVSDADLAEALAAAIGESGGLNQHGGYEARGLKVWIDTPTSQPPTIAGRDLVAQAREIYRIPQGNQLLLI